MNKRKVIIVTGGLICMSVVLYMIAQLLSQWETTSVSTNIIKILAIAGWCHITYNVITLKYKWLKRLSRKK